MDKKEKAKNYFIGKNTTRLNCAQSVIAVFDETLVSDFVDAGGGRKAGQCGAYYAACHLLKNSSLGQKDRFHSSFQNTVGSIMCNEIKTVHKVSCVDCVTKAIELLEESFLA